MKLVFLGDTYKTSFQRFEEVIFNLHHRDKISFEFIKIGGKCNEKMKLIKRATI